MDRGPPLSSVEVLNMRQPGQACWELGPPMPRELTAFAAVALRRHKWDAPRFVDIGGRLPDSDGGREGPPTNRVAALNVHTAEWVELPPLNHARANIAAAAAGGSVYVCGGKGTRLGGAYGGYCNVLGSVEYLGPTDDAWQMLPPMPTSRFFLAAVVVE